MTAAPDPLPPGDRPGRSYRWAVKAVLRVLIIALVVWGIWRMAERSRDEFARHDFSLAQLHGWWLAVAAALYTAGLAPCWWFWHHVLRAMGQRPRGFETLAAYFVGHLGKYVPGKALVVILRTGLVRGTRVDTTVAATSVFVETLTMMAVGATLAALVLAFTVQHPGYLLAALLLMALAGLPTLPPLFRRLVALLQVHRANPAIEQAVQGLDYRLMGRGWLGISGGWCLMGLSLWAVFMAMGQDTGCWKTTVAIWPLLIASVSLAMVVGFLSLLPGGLGSRDLVLATLIASQPQWDEAIAIVATILLRVVWLVSEVLLSAILYVAWRSQAKEA